MNGIGILDTRVNSGHCPYYRIGSGGLAWLCGCREQLTSVKMYPAQGCLCQGPATNHLCHGISGAATCGLQQHWNNNGIRPTSKHSECSGLLQPLHETCYCIHDSWSDCKNCYQISMPRICLDLWSTGQASEWQGRQFWKQHHGHPMDIQKARTLPYYVQANWQVKWAHQLLMQIIRKLSKDWKTDWPKYLPELVHAYNSPRSAITRYNQHYLMFGWCPCLPTDFYFPPSEAWKNPSMLTTTLQTCEWLCEAFKEAQVQSPSEAEWQRQYYDCKANSISLEPENVVLAKADAYKGQRKVKDQ